MNSSNRFSVWGQVFVFSVMLGYSGHAGLADEQLNTSIDKGVEYLKKQIRVKPTGQHAYGQVALETYALISSGVSVSDPLITKNFKILTQMAKGSSHTYTAACYIFALDAAIAQLEQDKAFSNPGKNLGPNKNIGRTYRANMATAVKTLIKTQNPSGAWRYFAANDFDNSNVQFAVLALGVGAKRGVPIPGKVWEGIYKHFVEGQQKNGPETPARIKLGKSEEDRRRDALKLVSEEPKPGRPKRTGSARKKKEPLKGRTVVLKPEDDPIAGAEQITVRVRGWDYENKGGATWNMTCAGVSSCLILRENIKGNIDKDSWKKLNVAIGDGYGYLMGTWTPFHSLYGLYSLEKVADIGGVKLFNEIDWYEQAKGHLIGVQQADGSWAGGAAHGENVRVATSFALLVLNRASSLLTRKPGGNIIISGKSEVGSRDRTWVYLPRLKTSIHYPAVLDLIRKRPSRQLLNILGDIVEAYPEQWRGELIPSLSSSYAKSSSKTIKRVLMGHLEEIAGIEYPSVGEYEKWHSHWSRALKAGQGKDASVVGELLNDYKDNLGSVELKRKAAWALTRIRDKRALELFLGDLENDSPEVRQLAYSSFKGFFVATPPVFVATGPSKTRARQVAAIRQWFAEQK